LVEQVLVLVETSIAFQVDWRVEVVVVLVHR
jgi:hypothetical protein